MSTKTLIPRSRLFPSVLDDFFKPWNEWVDMDEVKNLVSVPSVNVTENGDRYKLSMAIPGLKKEDLKIRVEGNMLTVSSEKKEEKEERDEKFTRKEFNYSSFSRSFTLPEGVKQDKIEASYADGLLDVVIPKTEVKLGPAAKDIEVK